jgi:hypothetical protein
MRSGGVTPGQVVEARRDPSVGNWPSGGRLVPADPAGFLYEREQQP